MKLSQNKPKTTHRILILGLSGSGKSTLAAEMAEHGYNLIWINIENAASTLEKLSEEAKERINLVNIPDTASYPIAAQTLMTLFKGGKAIICDEHGKHACPICAKNPEAIQTALDFSALTTKDIVVVDTGTQLSYSILAYTMKDKSIETKPERDDWGALRKYTEFFKSQFQGARFNLIVTCQCQEAELENGVMKLVPSFGSAGMSANFASGFDHVIYTEIKNRTHRAFCSSTANGSVLTRSRSDFMIENMNVPSLLPIFTGEMPTITNPINQNTPATNAVVGLTKLQGLLKK